MLNFLRSKTNESMKRLIALCFAVVLMIVIFFAIYLNYLDVLKQIVNLMFWSIWLLLGLATTETIFGLFSKK